MAITLHHQTQQTFSAGMHVEEESALYYMGIDFLVKRLDQLTEESQKEKTKLQAMNEKVKFLTFLFFNLHLALQCQNGKRVVQLHMFVFLWLILEEIFLQTMISKLDIGFSKVYWTHFILRYRTSFPECRA